MKAILFLFLLTVSSSFSQERNLTVKKINYNVKEIDSLCNIIRPYLQSSGEIKSKEGKIIGGFGTTIYKEYSESEKGPTIKAIYNEDIKNNNYIFYYYAEFYYDSNKEPFYLKLSIIRETENKIQKEIDFQLNKDDLISEKEIKNIFLLDLKSKIKSILKNL